MNSKIRKIISKKNKTKIVSLTAYSKSIAKILDRHVDIVLVGDSMAQVLYGHKNTHKINLKNIIDHTMSVKRGLKNSLLVADLPKNTYLDAKTAFKNAKLLTSKTKCDAVKIESNKNNYNIIQHLVKKNIPVMGHIGYTPQFKKKFKIEGQTKNEILKILEEAKAIEQAGAFSIVCECITPQAAKIVTKELKIPTIGIGSSMFCDGQVLVTDDLLGFSGFYPKFVKKYANLDSVIEKAVKKYTREVKLKKFPAKSNFLNGPKFK